MYTLANISNGLCFPHDDVCRFQSNHGHNWKIGYFDVDAMPWSAVIRLLRGESIRVIDATGKKKPLTDGLKYGLTTWAMAFNRGLGRTNTFIAPWSTREMALAAYQSEPARKVAHGVRRLSRIYGHSPHLMLVMPIGGLVYNGWPTIFVDCVSNFMYDDKPEKIREFAHNPLRIPSAN